MTTKKTSLFALAPLLAGALLTAAPVHAEAASVRSEADGGASAVQAHRKALSDAQTRLAKADEALAEPGFGHHVARADHRRRLDPVGLHLLAGLVDDME